MDETLRAILASWTFRPEVILSLGLLGGIYITGWRRLRQRGSRHIASMRSMILYLSGLVLLGLALLSPLDTMAALLFFFHMIQHLLITMLAPPLLLLSNPFPVMLWGLPTSLRQGLGRLLTRQAPLRRIVWFLTLLPVAWLSYVVTLWAWHHPSAYGAALRSEFIHDLEHLTFFGTSLLFWWPVINPAPRPHGHLAYGWRVLYVALATLQNTVLAVLLTLTDHVLYPYYLGVPRVWQLTAADDQMIGGTIMWFSGGMMYVMTLAILVALLLWTWDEARSQATPR
jgi:putative membrane protein